MTGKNKYYIIVPAILIVMVALIWNCAAIGQPSGGPVDETPPRVISVTPSTETLGISGGQKIMVAFSEYIDQNTIAAGFHLSPLAEQELELKYKDDEIIVTLPDSLIPDQTYILTVGRELKDEHGVALAEPVQLAYSTGDRIEKRSIAGRVYFNASPVALHLWDLSLVDHDSLFARKPHFRTDAADDGRFVFQYLRPAEYGILAIDRSGAGLALDPSRMGYGVYRELSVDLVSDSSVTGINIPVWREPQALRLLRGEWTNPCWGRLYLNNPVRSLPEEFRVWHSDSLELKIEAGLIIDPLDSTAFIIVTEDSLPAGKLVVRGSGFTDIHDQRLDTLKLEMKIPAQYDSTGLELLAPTKNFKVKSGRQKLELIFSKPMLFDSTITAIELLQSDTILVPVAVQQQDYFKLVVSSMAKLDEKIGYSVKIYRDSLPAVDHSQLADSLVILPFTVASSRGFGGLSAPIKNARFPAAVQLERTENSAGKLIYFVNSDSVFSQDVIPEGYYSLMIFQDLNTNRRFDFGQALPYSPSEWFYIYPDTIEVRANWLKELPEIDTEESN